MLTQAQMGGMDEMGIFYETCLESLYPPGKCGAFCNEHTYECLLAEVQQSCCPAAAGPPRVGLCLRPARRPRALAGREL